MHFKSAVSMDEESTKQCVLVASEISRNGGVEEVGRQVLKSLKDDGVVVNVILVGNRLQALKAKAYILVQMLLGNAVIMMHPFLFEYLTFGWVLKRTKSKKIVWAHGIDVWGRYGEQKTKKLIFADKIIAVSNYTRQQLLAVRPSLPVVVVNNAIDESLLENSSRSHKKNNFEIITVGRLSSAERYKGHDLVIEALSILKREGINIIYNIVGSGDDRSRLESLASNLEVGSSVIFHGYVPDNRVQNLYLRSSVFVMPSHVEKKDVDMWGGEGFGLVYLEAGLFGLPVIACDEGGQTDCILHDSTGYLVRPCAQEIANKLRFLFQFPEEGVQMGANGREHVLRKFTFQRFKSDVLSVVDL